MTNFPQVRNFPQNVVIFSGKGPQKNALIMGIIRGPGDKQDSRDSATSSINLVDWILKGSINNLFFLFGKDEAILD